MTELTESVNGADKIVDVLGNDMSRALRLAASVQRALPCADPLVMTLAAKVFGRWTLRYRLPVTDTV